MTTSANIAGVPTGFAPVPRGGAWPYSKKKIWHIDDLKPGKKPKIGSKMHYGQVGMLLLTRGGISEDLTEAKAKVKDIKTGKKVKSPQVVDKPGKQQDKYEYKGKVGVWRTIMGKRYFFPDDGSESIPPMKKGVKAKLGKDADDAVKSHKRNAAMLDKVITGLGAQLKDAEAQGMDAKARRIKKQIKDVKSGGMEAVKTIAAAKAKGVQTAASAKEKGGDEGAEGDWADYAEEKLLPKVRDAMKKAKEKENAAAFKVLKKMEAAIRKGDEKAFKKASAELKKAVKQVSKTVDKQKKKKLKKARKFKPGILGSFLKGLKR